MNILLDQLWIWIILTFAVGCCGFSWYLNYQKWRNLVIALLLPVLTLALGLTLYYGVETDQKTITRTLNALIAAVERDDCDSVNQLIHPKAQEVQQFAKVQMNFVIVSRAKYRDLQIEINDATSPPTANIRFSAFFYWKTKTPIEGLSVDQPIPEHFRFELELVKTKSKTWLLTDKFRYFRPNFL